MQANSKMSDSKQVPLTSRDLITPEGRLSFPSLFEPKPRFKGSPNLTYQCVLLLPPDTDMKPFHAAIKAAMVAKWGKVVQLPGDKNPIRSCSDKHDVSGYEDGWFYLNLHSRNRPGVVDRVCVPVTDPARVYPGMWVRAFINSFAWEHPSGGRGISFGLNSIQLVRDDERLDGRRDATQVFTPLGDLEGSPSSTPAADDLDAMFN